jgi:hypothetical protein
MSSRSPQLPADSPSVWSKTHHESLDWLVGNPHSTLLEETSNLRTHTRTPAHTFVSRRVSEASEASDVSDVSEVSTSRDSTHRPSTDGSLKHHSARATTTSDMTDTDDPFTGFSSSPLSCVNETALSTPKLGSSSQLHEAHVDKSEETPTFTRPRRSSAYRPRRSTLMQRMDAWDAEIARIHAIAEHDAERTIASLLEEKSKADVELTGQRLRRFSPSASALASRSRRPSYFGMSLDSTPQTSNSSGRPDSLRRSSSHQPSISLQYSPRESPQISRRFSVSLHYSPRDLPQISRSRASLTVPKSPLMTLSPERWGGGLGRSEPKEEPTQVTPYHSPPIGIFP